MVCPLEDPPSFKQRKRGGAGEAPHAHDHPMMAAGAFFNGVNWTNSSHRNTGKNVELTESNRVATKVRGKDYGLVFTMH